MKNRGFTLLELLGVIVILALLTTLVFPSVLNTIKKSSNETDKLSMDLISNATDLYIENHANDFEKINGSKFIIDMNELIEEGFLPESIKLTDVEKIEENYVLVKYDNDKFNYEVKSKNDFYNITGTNNLVLGSDNYNILNYKIYGNSVQNGTPTPDAPIEVESVEERTKNLLNSNTREYTNVGGIKVTYNEDGSIHYEGTSTMALRLYLTRTSFVLPAGTYTVNSISSTCRIYLLPGYKSGTFTITEDTTFTGVYLNVPNGTTLNDTLYPQLEEGRVETEFEPYGYKIPIKVSNGTEEITTNIYLDEPLRKIKDYADYIDFENKKVVRKITKIILDGTQKFVPNTKVVEGYDTYHTYYNRELPSGLRTNASVMSNKLIGNYTWTIVKDYKREQIASAPVSLTLRIAQSRGVEHSADGINNWLKENPIDVLFILETPIEETIELPNIPTLEGTTILSVDTAIQPSNIEIFGYNDN